LIGDKKLVVSREIELMGGDDECNINTSAYVGDAIKGVTLFVDFHQSEFTLYLSKRGAIDLAKALTDAAGEVQP
jgi:hypothetical protein